MNVLVGGFFALEVVVVVVSSWLSLFVLMIDGVPSVSLGRYSGWCQRSVVVR